MRRAMLLLIVPTTMLLGADAPSGKPLSFQEAKVGELPKGWTAAKTGKGEGSVWEVVKDETAPHGPNVLAQVSSKGPRPLFNLCVADETKLADLDLTVSFKAVTGKIDQGGGPVWRYRDADNYYIARMNPLEGNFRVYKVVGGKRTQLATADVEAPAGKWHTIRIVHQADRIQCYLNSKLHLDVKDDTFKDAGKVGVWTKADAVTYFGDLKLDTPKASAAPPKTGQVTRKLPPYVKSGPQVGERVPGPLHSVSVVDAGKPDLSGRKWDHVERYGSDPVVLVLARTRSDGLTKLLKSVDAEVARHKLENTKVHVLLVMLSDEAETKLKDFAAMHRLKHVSLSMTSPVGPPSWRIAEDADATVMLCSRRKVEATHAFRKGELDDQGIGAVIADLPKIVGR